MKISVLYKVWKPFSVNEWLLIILITAFIHQALSPPTIVLHASYSLSHLILAPTLWGGSINKGIQTKRGKVQEARFAKRQSLVLKLVVSELKIQDCSPTKRRASSGLLPPHLCLQHTGWRKDELSRWAAWAWNPRSVSYYLFLTARQHDLPGPSSVPGASLLAVCRLYLLQSHFSGKWLMTLQRGKLDQ